MSVEPALDRRQFVAATALVGGGMALGLTPSTAFAADNPEIEVTPWVTVTPDNLVTIRTASPEFGNGAMTQSVLAIAEELDCEWGKIRTEYASTNRDFLTYGGYSPVPAAAAFFGGRSTFGVRTKALLQVGASARERLKAAAAADWNVPVAELTTRDSVITHAASKRSCSYGDVAAKAAKLKLAKEPTPKPASEWRLLGKLNPAKLTVPAIVNGSAEYGIDVRVPDMVYAALRQSPVHGGRLKSFDAAKVKAMPGVLAVVTVDPDEPRGIAMMSGAPLGYQNTAARAGVAVIAEHYWQARQALDALPVEWDERGGAQWKTTEQLYEHAVAALDSDKNLRLEKTSGDVSKVSAKRTVEQTYMTPWCDQTTMEPLNGTALVTPERVEVWHPAQNSQQAYWVASDESGLVPERVFFHQTLVGGAFGRRLESDDVRMVVAIAKRFPGRPVHTIWSREEQTRQGKYRPMVAVRMNAALDDKSGLPLSLTAKQAARGHFPRLADTAYFLGPVPNTHVDSRELPEINVTPGPYRGPGYNSYAFILETFIDECAAAAGADPLDYRIRLLKDFPNPGWVKCLQEVKAKSGWGRKLPKGTAQGVAISAWGLNGQPTLGSVVAVVATVEVSKAGVLKVHQLDGAFDTGKIMNSNECESLMQGGMMFGLNMALNEEMTVKDGRMVEGNFDTYPMLRMADAPKMAVHFGGLSGLDRYSELGEPPIGPVGPAVGNAIFRATGKRVRNTPFRKHDLSWA